MGDSDLPISIRDLLWRSLSDALKPGPLQGAIVSSGVGNPVDAISRARYVDSAVDRVMQAAFMLARSSRSGPEMHNYRVSSTHILAALIDCQPDYVRATLQLSDDQLGHLLERYHALVSSDNQ